MAKRRTLIVGNWKMNGLADDGTALAKALADRYARLQAGKFDMVLCPPFTLIVQVAATIKGSRLGLGGQDCHVEKSGAHTGDISAEMLKDAGCGYVILGHSERRQNHGETDALVRAKAESARAAGLVSIVCVGETEDERDAGRAEAVVSEQIAGSVPGGATAANLVVAYEPVWAIGTGRSATPDDVAAMHAHIRKALAGRIDDASVARILYGGSVKPASAPELLSIDDVDGVLVGGASLKAEDFWEIAAASPA